MDIVRALFLALGALTGVSLLRWVTALYRSRSLARGASARVTAPGLIDTSIGFVTNFFDTLGIGSFATTTSTYKLMSLVPDERIPGTMLVGHTLPVRVSAWTAAAIPDSGRTKRRAVGGPD